MKRIFDVVMSLIGLVISAPVLVIFMALLWLQDRHSPLYIADRTGRNGQPFRMVKLRSMIKDAHKSGVDSTSADDKRITKIGLLIRRYKLDELTQLWNVLLGDMSLVGPRPNVKRETDLYTAEEKLLLSVRPGITDFASIVFSDEGEILEGSSEPDIAYNQLIRPGKSALGIFYVKNRNLIIDIYLIIATILAILSRSIALSFVSSILRRCQAKEDLISLALRRDPLTPMPPPGAKSIVTNREGRVE